MKFDWQKPAPLPLLVAGCSIGFLIALIGAVRPSFTGGGVPDHAVAMVNGVVINRADYLKHIEGLKTNKQSALTDDDREHVLERMIEEEVLVQRASEIGLLNSNRSVRGTIVRAMISAAISEDNARDVSESDLRDFYKDNINFFKTTSRLRLHRLMILDGKSAAENAKKAVAFVKEGGDFKEASKRWGQEPIAPLPDVVHIIHVTGASLHMTTRVVV